MTCRKGCRRLILAALAILLMGIAAGGGYLYWHAYGMFHPPRSPILFTPDDFGFTEWREVSFITEDGLRLDGWFIPPDPSGNGATLIAVHGMGGNRTSLFPFVAPLLSEGHGALFFDQRNHGTSEGSVTSLGYLEALDVTAALAFVRGQPGVAPDRIGLIAHSMGTAGTLIAAGRDGQVAATVTISAYASVADTIAPFMIALGEHWTGVPVGEVRPIDAVADLAPGAVFFIHGAQDKLIPAVNSEQLYEAAQEPKTLYIVPDGTHDSFLAAPSERVRAFFEVYLGHD